MATAAKLKPVPADEPGTDIAVIIAQDHAVALLDREKFNAFYDRLKADAPTDVDIATNKGRDTIRSYAAKVRSEKAAIDKDRLRLTKEWRDLTAQVNSAGKEIDEQLEALAVEIRHPLTAWEEREKAKNENRRRIIGEMRAFAIVTMDDTSATVRDRGTEVYKTEVTPALYEEMYEEAQSVKDQTIATLRAALVRLEKEEADRAELEKLRAAEAERVRIEEEKAAAAEVERQAAEAKRIAEEQRIAAEKADAERIAAAEKAAEDRAREAADQAAQAERDRVQREHDAVLAAEREKSAKMERGRQMLAYIREVVGGRIGPDVQPFGILLRELEIKIDVNEADYGDMCAEIERARVDGLANLKEQMERQVARRKAEEDRKAEHERQEEERKRQENRAHRSKIMGEVKADLMTFGVDEETARKIVTGIVAKTVRHTMVAF